MTTFSGPLLPLSKAPFDSLENITKWAAGLGYKGVQIPTIDKRVFDLELAVSSDTYIDEVKGICENAGVEITELSVHLQGQLLAVSPAYNESFDVFAPEEFRGNPNARTEWAIDQLKKSAIASERLGLKHMVGFTGSLAFPFLYPVPQTQERHDEYSILLLILPLAFCRLDHQQH